MSNYYGPETRQDGGPQTQSPGRKLCQSPSHQLQSYESYQNDDQAYHNGQSQHEQPTKPYGSQQQNIKGHPGHQGYPAGSQPQVVYVQAPAKENGSGKAVAAGCCGGCLAACCCCGCSVM
ncbi:hypothetical protein BJ878DRAFT_579296 [Calycina marina]|uniref:Cysteine-rich transmembrane CYSTM domain-containing protein n=1 Tax=Calycina marina TaxID=1763456 RepID=A0A9P8CB21_9HELO|nr:hypothetical protein BJ878DRAFT_579296 [Calycina marina]